VTVEPAARIVTRGETAVALTPKAYDLMLALVRREGAVATRVDLLREVWGSAGDIQTRTVDSHMAELRRKLEDNPAEPRHFLTVWKAGYRFEP
jgi:DNA-binding response OmpR family regulator